MANFDIGALQSNGHLDIAPLQGISSTPLTPVALSDTFVGLWTDDLQVVLNDAATLTENLFDQFSFSDDLQLNLAVTNIALSDSFAFSDQLTLVILDNAIHLDLNDTFSFSDSLLFSAAIDSDNLVLGDALVLNDQITLQGNFFIVIADSIPFADSMQLDFNVAGENLSDTLVLSDHLTLQLNSNINIVLADTFSFSDSILSFESTSFISYMRQYLNDVIN